MRSIHFIAILRFNTLIQPVMGTTKKELFSLEDNQVAAIAKAVGHPARVAILKQLSQLDACVCGELVEVLPLSQSTVSQHLKALKEAHLILGEVEGKNVCYCINKEVWEKAQLLLTDFFSRCC